jgi:signal transduction histidine kinase
LTSRVGYKGDILIEVSDTGEGIPDENLKKIFDPFFTTKGVGNGTGLGLAVTYGIIQEHAGSIEAVNNSSGSGATFRLSFPPADTQRHRAVS